MNEAETAKIFGQSPKGFSDLISEVNALSHEEIQLQQQRLSNQLRLSSPISPISYPNSDNYLIFKKDLFPPVYPQFSFKDAHALLCARDQLAFLNPNRSLSFLKYLGKHVFPVSPSLEVEGE